MKILQLTKASICAVVCTAVVHQATASETASSMTGDPNAGISLAPVGPVIYDSGVVAAPEPSALALLLGGLGLAGMRRRRS